jgi:hypothetical protein
MITDTVVVCYTLACKTVPTYTLWTRLEVCCCSHETEPVQTVHARTHAHTHTPAPSAVTIITRNVASRLCLCSAFHNALRDYKYLEQENLNETVHSHRKTKKSFFDN